METTRAKEKAVAALAKMRGKRYKLREISAATGVSISVLSNIGNGGWYFSDEIANKIIDGCKALGRKP